MKVLGLDLDNSPLLMENKSLKYALNIEVNNKSLSYFNEKGFQTKFTIPKNCIIQNGIEPSDAQWNNSTINIIGNINCPFNIILFIIVTGSVNTKAILSYNTKTNEIDKSYCCNRFNFNIENPIQGIYTYFKDDLIIIYTDQINELQILNITSFKETLYNELNEIDINKLNFIPDNNFNLSVKESGVNTGSLLTGSYQISVKFKTILGHYTNYSTLSETINIYGDYEALKVGSLTSRSININIDLLNNINIYKCCKIAIVYNNGESQLAYETNDIEITDASIINYRISDVNILNTISLEDIFIKNINYSYAKDISIMNNQLILGNISKSYPEFITYGVEISCQPIDDIETAILLQKPFFQSGEIYVFYIGLFNNKGDLIQIYPIEYSTSDSIYVSRFSCEKEILNVNNQSFETFRIPTKVSKTQQKVYEGSTWVYRSASGNEKITFISYNGNVYQNPENINVSQIYINNNLLYYGGLPIYIFKSTFSINGMIISEDKSDISDIFIDDITLLENLTHISNYTEYLPVNIEKSSLLYGLTADIKCSDPSYSCQIFYIKHDYNNSRILTTGVVVSDTEENNFKTQTYKGQFNSARYKRFYSFDFLFNKPSTINGYLSKIADLEFAVNEDVINDENYPNVFKWDDDTKTFNGIDPNGCLLGNIFPQDFTPNDDIQSVDINLNLILNNNSVQNNIAGDTYHKFQVGDIELENGVYNLYNLNPQYTSLSNNILQPASSIISVNNSVILKGDTYVDYLTLRITTPSSDFFHGDNQYPERDSNKTVYRWIINTPLITKLNINAHYSTITNPTYKLGQFEDAVAEYYYLNKVIELFDLSYEIDHPINNDLDINYSKVYNENGIENFIYGESLITNNKYPNRIVRSLYQNDESNHFNLITFKSDDYKDLPAKYGEITVINNNDQFLYVHQKYNLSYLSIRDTLTNDQAGNSYLSSSDLFNIEAKSLLYNPTGFISCISKFDTLINETGYYCIDNEVHKIFKINKDSIKDITSENVKYWFKDNLLTLEKNNPYTKKGRYLNFDIDNNTLYIVQNDIENDFTLSYNTNINKWISFHSYKPIIGLNNNSKIYWLNDKRLFIKDDYVHGKYIDGHIYESYLKFILNPHKTYNKLFKTIVWLDRIINTTSDKNTPIKNKTFNQIAIFTDTQCSDWKTLNDTTKWYDSKSGVNVINQWRFNDIWDVASANFHTDSPSTFKPGTLTNTKWYKRNKIYDQFVYVMFQIKNGIDQHELIDIDVEFDLDNRNKQHEDKKE